MASVMGLGPLDEKPAMTGDGLTPNWVSTGVMRATGVLVSFREVHKLIKMILSHRYIKGKQKWKKNIWEMLRGGVNILSNSKSIGVGKTSGRKYMGIRNKAWSIGLVIH